MKLLEAIKKGASFLEEKGVDSARLNVELLLEHILKTPRLQLYMDFERELTETQTDELRQAIKRRGNREPLQHIIGSTEFCGLEIEVSKSVLIPRPETESLAELAIRHLEQSKGLKILEIGTGSGCLPISIVHKTADTQAVSIDVSSEALEVAQRNVDHHDLGSRIQLIHGDALELLSEQKGFDLLVTNPPYIPAADIETLDPEVRDHDPRLALDGGPDGLDFYRHLASHAAGSLTSEGCLMAEYGDGQGPAIQSLFEEHGWKDVRLSKDFTDRDRFVIASAPSING